MRVSEDRYSRDLRRIELARRLIRHEARTHAICAWTGLSDERVRNLFRSYQDGAKIPRHRGPTPKRIETFLRSPSLRDEASAIAGLACFFGVVPPTPVPDAARSLPGLATGERLCHTFEFYKELVPESRCTIEQLMLLVVALAQGEELELRRCSHCDAALLVDRLGTSRRICQWCRRQGLKDNESRPASELVPVRLAAEPGDAEPVNLQQSLF